MLGWDAARDFKKSCSPEIPGIYDQYPVKQTGQSNLILKLIAADPNI